MKVNLPVTGKESDYPEGTTIVSTTDLKGRITYANPDLIRVSGFSEEELAGKSHNIIRHPEMPPAAFADLWKTMKQGDTWIGIVNNRCKNGDHYWVDAFVAPVYENNTIVGYQSVREKPPRELINRADRLYKDINAGKLTKRTFASIGYRNKLLLGILAAVAPMALSLALPILGLPAQLAYGALVVSVVMAFVVSQALARPLLEVAKASRSIIDNPIARYVYSGRTDEVGQIQAAFHMQKSRLRTLIGRVSDASEKLHRVSTETAVAVESTSQGILRQNNETDQVAATINELAATVQEVEETVESVAHSAEETKLEADKVKNVVAHAIGSINKLEDQIQQASTVINKLDEESIHIGKILEVVQNVAEQTNLLALNAAIEAARAGEAGRGFAVVAEEVRTLAERTARSTSEIQSMIQQLQAGTKNAVCAMNIARTFANESASDVGKSGDSLNAIAGSVSDISDMNHQIAIAAEQQSIVAKEVNRNVHEIYLVSQNISAEVQQSAAACNELTKMASDLQNVVKQCDF